MNSKLKKLLCATALTLAAASSAQATVLFTAERVSNTSVVLKGSGTLDGPQAYTNLHMFSLDGLVTNLFGYDVAGVLTSSTLKVGSIDMNFAYAMGPGFSNDSLTGNPVVEFGHAGDGYPAFQIGATVSGEIVMDITSTKALFAPVGTVGNVLWGVGGPLTTVGTFEVVDQTSNVPEPASLALLAGGLLAVGAARRSRRA